MRDPPRDAAAPASVASFREEAENISSTDPPEDTAFIMRFTSTLPPAKRTLLRKSAPFPMRRVRTTLRRLAASMLART